MDFDNMFEECKGPKFEVNKRVIWKGKRCTVLSESHFGSINNPRYNIRIDNNRQVICIAKEADLKLITEGDEMEKVQPDFKPGDRVRTPHGGLGTVITKEKFIEGHTEELHKFYDKDYFSPGPLLTKNMVLVKLDKANLCMTQLTHEILFSSELELVDEKEFPKPSTLLTKEDVDKREDSLKKDEERTMLKAITLATKYADKIDRDGKLCLSLPNVTIILEYNTVTIDMGNFTKTKFTTSNEDVMSTLRELLVHANNRLTIDNVKDSNRKCLGLEKGLDIHLTPHPN